MPLPSFSRGSSPIQPNRMGELKKSSIGSKFKPVAPSPFSTTPKDESFFGGKSQVSRFQISRSLRRDPKLREQMRKDFKLKTQKELNAEIDKIEARIPKRFGGGIDKAEAKRLLFEEYYNKRRAVLDAPNSPTKAKEAARRNKEYEFLKKKFGIK